MFIVANGEHDERDLRRLGAHLIQGFEIAGIGEKQVEEDHVELLIAEQGERFLQSRGAGKIRRWLCAGEEGLDEVRITVIVLLQLPVEEE